MWLSQDPTPVGGIESLPKFCQYWIDTIPRSSSWRSSSHRKRRLHVKSEHVISFILQVWSPTLNFVRFIRRFEDVQKFGIQIPRGLWRLHTSLYHTEVDRWLDEWPTMARWKSGLFPFEVFAYSVNCDTQRISPSMSFTLDFHIFCGLAWSAKSRRDSLRDVEMGVNLQQQQNENLNKMGGPISGKSDEEQTRVFSCEGDFNRVDTDIFLDNMATSASLSSVMSRIKKTSHVNSYRFLTWCNSNKNHEALRNLGDQFIID